MLQNRVDPFGNLIRTKARGTFTGTRGIIHNERREIVRAFKLKAWLTCLPEFRGRKRVVMTPDRYTELFFLDEATAFAAGHRPCAECRRVDFNRFKLAWITGNPEYDFNLKTSINEIDKILQYERIGKDKQKITFKEKPSELPDGVFVAFQEQAYLIKNNALYLWTPFGYSDGIEIPDGVLDVLTPRSIVNAFRVGYIPSIYDQQKSTPFEADNSK